MRTTKNGAVSWVECSEPAAVRQVKLDPYQRGLALVIALALSVCVLLGLYRVHKESQAKHVEIAMDSADFSAMARAYGYNEEQFLIALRRAGLTSLAVSEELGSGINSGQNAILIAGQSLIDQARLSPLTEPVLARLAQRGELDSRDLYLIVVRPSEVARYRATIARHFGPSAVRVLQAENPTILAIRSQIDYFSALGFGFPGTTLELVKRTGLLLEPRFQNDDRYGANEIREMVGQFHNGIRPSTVIFFGSRNEVLGYPDHVSDTADALKAFNLNFGTVEVYDNTQLQKGNDGLAQAIIGQTVRVQAIAKAEQDKLKFNVVVARYLLGVAERNVRVVYLRPWLHPENGRTVEGANIEMVHEIAEGLSARGFKLGRATPILDFHIPLPIIALAALAVPAGLLFLLDLCGWNVRPRAWWVYAGAYALLALGALIGHELAALKALALMGAIVYATLAVVAIAPEFSRAQRATFWATFTAGLRIIGIGGGIALCGAFVVVALLSVPVLMEEIDRFSGVKAVILLPPLILFALAIFTPRFGAPPLSPSAALREPVRFFHFAFVGFAAAAAALYILRSGNSSEIAPSTIELSLRSGLTTVLGVRPRFKEFMIGFPLMMLLPALPLRVKRGLGWLFVAGIGIGTADIVDTFSHLHTSLTISLVRLLNGAVLGLIVGVLLVLAVRAVLGRSAPSEP